MKYRLCYVSFHYLINNKVISVIRRWWSCLWNLPLYRQWAVYSLKMFRSPRRSFFRIEDLLTTPGRSYRLMLLTIHCLCHIGSKGRRICGGLCAVVRRLVPRSVAHLGDMALPAVRNDRSRCRANVSGGASFQIS